MREIKFRVYSLDLGEMIAENITLNDRIDLYAFDGDEITEQEGNVIMQYTGLIDKNGVEIYEGDILGMCEEYGGSSYFPLVVEAGYARYQCYSVNNNSNKIPFTNISVEYYEVIGNVYDNPELLEKG